MRRLMLAAALVLSAAAARAAAVNPVAGGRIALHQQVDNLRAGLPLNLQPEIDRMTPDYRAKFSFEELERLRQAYTNELAVLIQLSVATQSAMRKDDLELARRQFERSKQKLLSLLFQVCASRFPDAAGGIGTDSAAAAFSDYFTSKMTRDAEARELLKLGHLNAGQRERIGRLLEKLSGVPELEALGSAALGLAAVEAETGPRDAASAAKKARALTLSPSDFQARVNLRRETAAVPPPPQEIEAVLRGRGATPEMIKSIMAASRKTGLDPLMIASFMSAESSFRPGETNEDSGASGLMQLIPETARGWGVKDIYSIPQNVMAGARHLTYLQALLVTDGTDFNKDDLARSRKFAMGKLAAGQANEIRAKIAAAFGAVRDLFERARPLVEARLGELITAAEEKTTALAAAKGWSAQRAGRAVAQAVAKARDQAVQSVFRESVIGSISDEVKYVIGAYNAGEGRIKQYAGLPPFRETQVYVPRVLFRYFTNYLLAAENALGVANFQPGPELNPQG